MQTERQHTQRKNTGAIENREKEKRGENMQKTDNKTQTRRESRWGKQQGTKRH